MQPNYYAIIPADVRYNSNLSFLERFLYCEITALSNLNGYCFATNEYFGKLYSKDEKTISRAINNLRKEKHILVDYEKKGAQVTNRKIYPLTQKQSSDIFVTGETSTSDIFVTREEQKVLNAIRKKVTHNNITYKYIFNIITNIAENDISTTNIDNLESLFKTFYSAYPRKQDNAKAKKAFLKLKPDDNLFEEMMRALELQKKSTQWKDKQYIPLPATWINGKRWEDEISSGNGFVEKKYVYDYGDDTGSL